jgi:prepilin-type N-terminal cleavage/methylation domain-containing protein
VVTVFQIGTEPVVVALPTLQRNHPRRIPRRDIHIEETNAGMHRKPNTGRGGFTLVEVMVVIAIIALLAFIAVPNFLRGRNHSQATEITEDLRLISGAVDQYAIETGKPAGFTVEWQDIQNYVKRGTRLCTGGGNDILGNPYGNAGTFVVGQPVFFSLATFQALSDAALADFWSSYAAK